MLNILKRSVWSARVFFSCKSNLIYIDRTSLIYFFQLRMEREEISFKIHPIWESFKPEKADWLRAKAKAESDSLTGKLENIHSGQACELRENRLTHSINLQTSRFCCRGVFFCNLDFLVVSTSRKLLLNSFFQFLSFSPSTSIKKKASEKASCLNSSRVIQLNECVTINAVSLGKAFGTWFSGSMGGKDWGKANSSSGAKHTSNSIN